MAFILGIDGYKGAGKDTAAKVLLKYGFVQVSFADALRDSVSECFEIPLNSFIDRDLKDSPMLNPLILKADQLCNFCELLGFEEKMDEVVIKFKGKELSTPRDALKFIGTEIGRNTLSNTIWLDQYKKRIASNPFVVTPDCRFENERNLIKDLNGRIMFIVREGVDTEDSHVSENQKWPLDQYDIIVYNDSTEYQLMENVGMWWCLNGQ